MQNKTYTVIAQVAYTHPQIANSIAQMFIKLLPAYPSFSPNAPLNYSMQIEEASNGNIDVQLRGPSNLLMMAAAPLADGWEAEVDEDEAIITFC